MVMTTSATAEQTSLWKNQSMIDKRRPKTRKEKEKDANQMMTMTLNLTNSTNSGIIPHAIAVPMPPTVNAMNG